MGNSWKVCYGSPQEKLLEEWVAYRTAISQGAMELASLQDPSSQRAKELIETIAHFREFEEGWLRDLYNLRVNQ